METPSENNSTNRIIYKFRPINDYLVSLLLNNELYFSNAPSLNDPYDCYQLSELFADKNKVKLWLERDNLKNLPFYMQRYKDYEDVDFELSKVKNYKRFFFSRQIKHLSVLSL